MSNIEINYKVEKQSALIYRVDIRIKLDPTFLEVLKTTHWNHFKNTGKAPFYHCIYNDPETDTKIYTTIKTAEIGYSKTLNSNYIRFKINSKSDVILATQFVSDADKYLEDTFQTIKNWKESGWIMYE